MRIGSSLSIIFLLQAGLAWAQVSPGTLSKAHSFLDGPRHCVYCHDIAKSSPEFRCLECHKEIRQRLNEKVGLHPSMVDDDKTGQACAACHSEHNGRDVSLIHWDTAVKDFDHRRAGYTLEGKHSRTKCKDCHQPSHISPTMAASLSAKNLDRTFLGLTRQCQGCHFDEHRGQLPSNCDRCHDFMDWKNGAHFNHGTAKFTLAGAHEKVACAKCHTRIDDLKPYSKYKELSYQDCAPCHLDPHRGAFQSPCSSCHTPVSWKPYQISSVFDHRKTPFPLDGKHAVLLCNACHKRADFKEPVAHVKCADCHKTDPHRGQFTNLAAGGECASCHTVKGFKPSTFGVEQHRATPYPLLDRHAAVSCAKCHQPKGPDTIYRIADTHCSACHADVHKEQFRGPPYHQSCEDCHTQKGFKPSTFTLIRHRTTRFALSGAHAAVICTECHKSLRLGNNMPEGTYRFENRVCAACHQDPHQGQFAERMTTRRSDGTVPGCEACHGTKSWHDLPGFDHATTSFVLEGTHRGVFCEQCHKSTNLETGLRGVIFRSTPHQCSSCHEDVHGGQFDTRMGSGSCDRCHKVLKWKPSTFNHDADSTYHLTGAHRNVACALCHRNSAELAGKTVLVFKRTPRECLACHGNGIGTK